MAFQNKSTFIGLIDVSVFRVTSSGQTNSYSPMQLGYLAYSTLFMDHLSRSILTQNIYIKTGAQFVKNIMHDREHASAVQVRSQDALRRPYGDHKPGPTELPSTPERLPSAFSSSSEDHETSHNWRRSRRTSKLKSRKSSWSSFENASSSSSSSNRSFRTIALSLSV